MGYSCRKDAADRMDRFPVHPGTGSQNSWDYKGRRYFWERGREQGDGAITGTIYRMISETQARRVGSFRIAGDGDIVRAPYGMAALLR